VQFTVNSVNGHVSHDFTLHYKHRTSVKQSRVFSRKACISRLPYDFFFPLS